MTRRNQLLCRRFPKENIYSEILKNNTNKQLNQLDMFKILRQNQILHLLKI